jgi:hypothetical protein
MPSRPERPPRTESRPRARHAYRWLALLPALAVCVGVPLADRVRTPVAGLPFLLAWIVGCVLLTSVVMAVVYALDHRPPRA